MDNINAAGTTGLQSISLPESSSPQPNAPIAADLDKAQSAPTSVSIRANSSLSLPDWAYSKWASMHESQDGRSFDELVEALACQQDCLPNDVSVALLTNINCLESSVRFGAFNAFRNSDPADNSGRFGAIATDTWLENFAEDVRVEVRDALKGMTIRS
ncbi:hypothetical protein [Pandoraea anhela]|uniref:Uncharacterized protein n=1 Tax=Pandoraea anhela TaxID=2508295 RepID=A0A5E4T2I4_9BURK|nr:hypothetical protein [Pandoraea anhela]VVD80249.1 hypothetical protein PAN31108_01068 [Pandoraea anhela]